MSLVVVVDVHEMMISSRIELATVAVVVVLLVVLVAVVDHHVIVSFLLNFLLLCMCKRIKREKESKGDEACYDDANQMIILI